MPTTTQQHIIAAALIKRAATIEADLAHIDAKAPTALQLVLVKARRKAIDACEQLIYAEPSDAQVVMSLQNEVRLFIDLVEFSKAILLEASEEERGLKEGEAEDLEIVTDLVLGGTRSEDEGD